MFSDITFDINKMIMVSWRQLERWYRAALQDTDIKIANLHIDYAVNGLDTLRMLVDDNQIMRATGVNPVQFRDKLIIKQDEIQRDIIRRCNNL